MRLYAWFTPSLFLTTIYPGYTALYSFFARLSQAGDVVFFHPQTIHGSGVNKRTASDSDPDAFRKAVSVHYRRGNLAHIDWSELPVGKTMVDSRSPKEVLTSEAAKRAGVTTLEEAEAFAISGKGRKALADAFALVHHQYITQKLSGEGST